MSLFGRHSPRPLICMGCIHSRGTRQQARPPHTRTPHRCVPTHAADGWNQQLGHGGVTAPACWVFEAAVKDAPRHWGCRAGGYIGWRAWRAPIDGAREPVVISDPFCGQPPARITASTAESFHTASLLDTSRRMFLLFGPLSEATADSPTSRCLGNSWTATLCQAFVSFGYIQK